MTLGVDFPFQFNEFSNLALVTPEILRRIIESLSIVEINMSLAEASYLIEELLLFDEPVVDQGAKLGISIGSLKYST